jgi:3-oxoacyl-[acyl-carrier protein] reductase
VGPGHPSTVSSPPVVRDRQRPRTVLITGGGSGLGAATALRLASEGLRVHVAGRRAEALRATAEAARGPHPVRWHVLDVTDPAATRAVMDDVVGGGGRLDAVVNNAGVFRRAPASVVTPEEWDLVLRTNLTGALYVAQAAVAVFRTQTVEGGARGHLVNVNSGAGLHGYAPGASYAASKHGLMGLSDSLRREVAVDAVKVSDVVVATAVASDLSGRGDVPRLPADAAARSISQVLSVEGEAVISRIDLGQLSDWS